MATVFTKDFWGFEGNDIYRMSSVGIGSSVPSVSLDVIGDTKLQGKLNVIGVSTFGGNIDANANLDVDGHTELDDLRVSGVSTFTNTVHSASVLASFLQSSGNIIAIGNLQTSSGGVIAAYANISGNAGIGSLAVSGISTFSGNVNVGGAVITNPSANALDFSGSITARDVITAGALLHEGDTDTLVHFSAADTIDFKTFGIARLTVNNFGVTLGGTLNVNGQRIIVGDSLSASDDRIVLGNSDDLILYHDSANSYIENNTGILKILGNTIQLGDGTDKVGIGTVSYTHLTLPTIYSV